VAQRLNGDLSARVLSAVKKLTGKNQAWAAGSVIDEVSRLSRLPREEVQNQLHTLEDRRLIFCSTLGGKEVVVFTADR
jgi:RIO-like serine/threonine protein kinase